MWSPHAVAMTQLPTVCTCVRIMGHVIDLQSIITIKSVFAVMPSFFSQLRLQEDQIERQVSHALVSQGRPTRRNHHEICVRVGGHDL